MASSSGGGNNSNNESSDYVIAEKMKVLRLLLQMDKSNENQVAMQTQTTALITRQDQAQPQVPVQPNVGTKVVIQSKDNDPNALYEKFMKRGATEFSGKEDALQADEWLEHIKDIFETVVCNQKQKVVLTASMLQGVANVWWKSVRNSYKTMPNVTIWEMFKKQFRRKFILDHVHRKRKQSF